MKTTLHREYYVDRAWFDEESKNIFHNDWFCIGRLEDFHVAGDYKLIDIAGQSLIILRGSDDNVRGFYNFCRHRGCELVDTKNLIKESDLCIGGDSFFIHFAYYFRRNYFIVYYNDWDYFKPPNCNSNFHIKAHEVKNFKKHLEKKLMNIGLV